MRKEDGLLVPLGLDERTEDAAQARGERREGRRVAEAQRGEEGGVAVGEEGVLRVEGRVREALGDWDDGMSEERGETHPCVACDRDKDVRHLAGRRTTSLILLVSEREQESPLVLDLPMVETGRLAYAEPASKEASVSCATRTKEGDDEGEEGTHSSPHVGQYALTQSSRRSGLKSMTRARKRYSPSALSASADEIDCCVRPLVSEIEAAGVRHDSSGCVRAK